MKFRQGKTMNRDALSLVELLVVIAIIGILIALLLPALDRNSGVATKRIMCRNNLRQIALAMTNYHSANQQFPAGTGYRYKSPIGSSDQLGAFVQLLPFLDEAETFEQITQGCTIRSTSYAPCPALDAAGFEPWEVQNPIFICNSVPEHDSRFAVTHYALCIGDRARNVASPESARGAFGGSIRISFDDIGDGASNTIMAAEIGARTDGTKKNLFAVNQPASILGSPVECFELIDSNGANWQFNKRVSLSSIGRGGHWADGRVGPALFNTILPPNSPSVSVGNIGTDGIYSASGPHKGGLNIVRLDGSVAFIDENIDAGDSSKPTLTEEEMATQLPSPYGAWGALGTINDGEVVDGY